MGHKAIDPADHKILRAALVGHYRRRAGSHRFLRNIAVGISLGREYENIHIGICFG